MPIGTPTQHTSVCNDGTSVTTGSFTPVADSRLFAFANGFGSTLPTTLTISDSLGGTWTEIGENTFDYTSSRDVRSKLFYQDIGGSPAAMTVTVSSTGANETCVSLQSITGSNADFDNIQFSGSNTGDPSFSLAAVGGTSAIMVWVAAALGVNSYTITGYTELQDLTISTPGGDDFRHLIAYDLSSPATTINVTSNNARAAGWAMELTEGASDATITGSHFSDPDSFGSGDLTSTFTIGGVHFSDPDSFGAGEITQFFGIIGSHFEDPDSFGAGTVTPSNTIVGSHFVDPDSFGNGVLDNGGGGGGGTTAPVLDIVPLRKHKLG